MCWRSAPRARGEATTTTKIGRVVTRRSSVVQGSGPRISISHRSLRFCRAGCWSPPEPRKVLPSTAITRRRPGLGAVRWAAHSPASASKASASRCCKVRRNVDSDGTGPAHPQPGQGLLIGVGGPLGDRGERARPASTAHAASAKMTTSRCRIPRRWWGSVTLASSASSPGGSSQAPSARSASWPKTGQSVMMTRRA